MTVYPDPEIVVNTVVKHLSEQHNNTWRCLDTPHIREMSWSTLYFVTLTDGTTPLKLVIKIAHFPDQTVPEVSWQSEELLIRNKREFDTMTTLFRHFATCPDPLLLAVQPRAYVPAFNAVVMDYVSGALLYEQPLKLSSLLTPAGRRDAGQILQRTGAWLRWFHRVPLALDQVPPDRLYGPANTFNILQADAAHLRQYGIDLNKLAGWDATLTLLETVPTGERVWVHGDFHPNNLLLLANGGILSFDTAFEQVDSPYVDLAKFIVNIKTRRMRILSLGLLPPSGVTRSLVDKFLQGYLNGQPLDRSALALYEGRFLLEKWAETLDTLQSSKKLNQTPLGRILRQWIVNPFFYGAVRQWMAEARGAANQQA